MISKSKKFVFIHPPRVGGSSIESTLRRVIPDMAGGKHCHTAHNTVDRKGYFRFSMARNPWDRMVSIFFHCQRLKKWIPKRVTFREFLFSFEKYMNMCPHPAILKKQQVNWFGGTFETSKLDYIGRYESYQESWEHICMTVYGEIIDVLHLKDSGHKPYREYYTDDDMVQMVRKLHPKDTDSLGYTL